MRRETLIPAPVLEGPPRRVQLARHKGWRMPANTAKVDRSSQWGNPWRIFPTNDLVWADVRNTITGETLGTWLREAAIKESVAAFERGVTDQFKDDVHVELYGKHLGCWCPLTLPCHGDSLLRWANES